MNEIIAPARVRMKESFAGEAQAFLRSIIGQRSKVTALGKGRKDNISMVLAIDTLKRYLDTYYYNDEQMASFIIRHLETIQEIIPGEGSNCHDARTLELLKLYSRAVNITSMNNMKKNDYYHVTNDYGEAFVKTTSSGCMIASLSYDGNAEVKYFNTFFRKQSGDIAVEISHEQYVRGLIKVIEKIKKDNGL